MKKLIQFALACSLVGLVSVSHANAQVNLNHRTVLTFSQPVEVPGKILPAGTYTFELHDSGTNRHVVEIFDQTGTKLVALVLAIPDYRLKATDETVIRFKEVAAGQPQAIRAWFYPGQTVGQELVYSKTRARELAAGSNVVVPAVDDAVYANVQQDTLKIADVVAVTPERKEVPITAIQMTPVEHAAMIASPPAAPRPVTAPAPKQRKALPRTASDLPMIALLGFGALALGFAVRRFSAQSPRR